MTMNVYLTGKTPDGKNLTSSNGSDIGVVGITDIGPITQSHNRIRTGLAETYAEATNTVTWPESNEIHEVSILVTATDADTVGEKVVENYNLVTVNAPNAVVAAAMLTEVDSASTDAQLEKFKFGEVFVIRSKTVITRLDFLPVDVSTTLSNIHLFVGAH